MTKMRELKKVGGILVGVAIFLIIILSFVKIDFDSQAVYLCEATSANPGLEMENCPAHTSNTPWLLMALFAIAGSLIVVGSYFFLQKPINKKELHLRKFEFSTLNEDERKICDLIKENSGSIYQSEIVNKTGFSKVKVTRILDSLEHDRLIIERKRRGMTNIVVMK